MGQINSNKPLFDDSLKFARVMFVLDLGRTEEEREAIRDRVDSECEFHYWLDDGQTLGDSARAPLTFEGEVDYGDGLVEFEGHPALTTAQQNAMATGLKLMFEWAVEQSKYKGA